MRLSILGGSSPFTVELLAVMARAPVPGLKHVTLFGRDARSLASVAAFAEAHLREIDIAWTTDADCACRGFDIVLHQIRYGGMAGRAADEQVAARSGAVPDESIGPSALASALRLRDPLCEMARRIAAGSPNARVINLTNPLSVSTSLLAAEGVSQPIGICELPTITAMAAARLAGMPFARLSWQYSGLNHRGFLHHLVAYGIDLLPIIAERAGESEFGGLAADELVSFGALPTKYFQLFSRGLPISRPGRAAALEALRQAILAELEDDPTAFPPSLAERDQPWWELSVVPLLHALAGERPRRQILNLVQADGVTREGWCSVSARGVEWLGSPAPSGKAREWIARFEAHERAMLAAMAEPSEERVAEAEALDPLRPAMSSERRLHPHPASPAPV